MLWNELRGLHVSPQSRKRHSQAVGWNDLFQFPNKKKIDPRNHSPCQAGVTFRPGNFDAARIAERVESFLSHIGSRDQSSRLAAVARKDNQVATKPAVSTNPSLYLCLGNRSRISLCDVRCTSVRWRVFYLNSM